MVFRIPKRKTPVRVSLREALDYVLRGSINQESENQDFGLLLHLAHTRIVQFVMTPPHLRDAIMQPLPEFRLDPVLIASAIVDGIVSGALSVEGLPPEYLQAWRARPAGIDWSSGVVMLGNSSNMFTPTLALVEVDAIFRQAEPAPTEATRPETNVVRENSETPKLRNRTGPRPAEMERLKQAMRSLAPTHLREAKLFELMTLLKAKQTSVRAAKAAVLAEFAEQELRKTPNKEK